MERVKAATGMGGERGGKLPRLDTEEGWEHKQAGYGGRGTEGRAYCSGYEGQEVCLVEGVPEAWGRNMFTTTSGSGPVKFHVNGFDFWLDYSFSSRKHREFQQAAGARGILVAFLASGRTGRSAWLTTIQNGSE